MSVGYMTAILRRDGHQVNVLSPLAVGVEGYPRLTRPGALGFLKEWAKYRTATTRSSTLRAMRENVASRLRPTNDASRSRTLDAFRTALRTSPGIVLISAYSMYRETCTDICRIAAANNIPVVAGGPLFNHDAVAKSWLAIDGLTGVFAGEPEEHLSALVTAVGLGTDACIPGYRTRGQQNAPLAPLVDLDAVPFPDYSDFPWDKYPRRIIPMMTGRGCGWGVCTFCSDVVTTSGRHFRTRSLTNVLDELKWQSKRHNTTLFTFLDLKLNSDPKVWNGLASEIQNVVPGAEWTASIHAHIKQNDGLSAGELAEARRAGLVRITTGLESGSRSMLNAMAKGTSPEVLSQTVRHAAEAGISVRLTVIAGYPGETAEDLRQTSKFLDAHRHFVDRVVVNRFSLQLGTEAERLTLNHNPRMKAIKTPLLDVDLGTYSADNITFHDPGHRRAMLGLLMAAHRINRKPLSEISVKFEGVM